MASLRPGLAGQGQGLGAVAAPGGAASGLMLCDRAAPPDNWLPPAEKGCGLVSPAGVCAGVCGGGQRAHVCLGGPAAVSDGHRLRGPGRVPGVRLLGRSGLKVSRHVSGL